MNVLPTKLSGLLIIDPRVFKDQRGFFVETYQEKRYRESGIDVAFVQDNHSRSARGTLRGLHLQLQQPQAKLVRVVEGSVFDVAVDCRPGSQTFGEWVSVELSADNFRQLFVPAGFAHGFLVTSEFAQFEYKCSDYYHPQSELTVRWDDPALGITWPMQNPSLSAKDSAGLSLVEAKQRIEIARAV